LPCPSTLPKQFWTLPNYFGSIEIVKNSFGPKEGQSKVEKILKGCLDLISSPSLGWNVCLRCKGKTLLGIINKLFVFKCLLTTSSNVLPLHLSRS
jgi:hypothetical protein